MKAEIDLQQKKKEHFREVSDRLTAASHVQVEYFAKHTKIEGYYESQMAGHLFGCDRLMKQENMHSQREFTATVSKGRDITS